MAWFEYHNAGNSEAQQMQSLAFLFAQDTVGKAKSGVLVGLGVSQTTTASTSVVVSAGAGVVQAATLDGASLVGDVQDNNLDILTGSPMGSVSVPRNDIVVADRATGSIRAIIGNPNVTPTDPTVPSSALPLARIRNAANATSIPSSAIDDLRVFTTLAQPAAPTVQSASIVAGWTGYVKYVVEGSKVTVTYGVQRATATGTLAAWDFLTVATGLPKSADARPGGAAGLQHGLAVSNGTQYAQFAHGVDPTFSGGTVLSLQPRWVNQSISAGTWFSGSFSYFTV